VATEEALEEALEEEDIVMVAAAAKLGVRAEVLERPESEWMGVVTRVEEVREDEKTEASMVSESLSSGRVAVEEVEEDEGDCSVGGVGEKMELTAESGV